MNDFPCCSARPASAPSYVRYGRPSPEGSARRRLAGPLDERLVDLFDQLTTSAFDLGRLDVDVETEQVGLDTALVGVGVRVLGSAELVRDVLTAIGDGPAEGALLATLGLLWDEEIIDLGPALVRQLRAHGVLG